jgi:secreted trypsin-like serine protease
MFAGTQVNLFDTPSIVFQDQKDLLAVFAVPKFDTEFTSWPILPGDDYVLSEGDYLRVVAFGDTDPNEGYGQQRQAQFKVAEVNDVRIVASSASGICPGDSGGAAFADTAAKPRQLIAICDSNNNCTTGGVFASVIGYKKWITDTMQP